MTDLTLKENEQWLNGYKAGYAQAQETDLAMPRKEWVGLTNDEIDALHKKDRAWPLYSNIARDIEAKLKEKNT